MMLSRSSGRPTARVAGGTSNRPIHTRSAVSINLLNIANPDLKKTVRTAHNICRNARNDNLKTQLKTSMRRAGFVEVHCRGKQTLAAANAILDDEFNSTSRDQGTLATLIRAEQLLRDVLANILNEVFEFELHAVHLLAHVQDYFYTGEIHAEVASEVEDKL